MTPFIRHAAMLLTLLVAAPVAHAQVYKCVDKAGKTVYSQAPCPSNTKAANVRQSVTPASALPPLGASAKADGKADPKAKAGPMTPAEMEQDFRKRRAEQEEAAKKEQEKLADAKSREENCRSSRAALASLESGARQSRVNDKGERVFLEDAQLAQETERTRKAVQDWCK